MFRNQIVALSILLIAGVLKTSQASELDISMIQTSFWRAPQVGAFHANIEIMDEDRLIKSCQEYKRRISTLSLPSEKYLVEKYRISDSFVMSGEFSAKFLITGLEKTIKIPEISDEENKTSLPFYLQTEATTTAFLNDPISSLFVLEKGSFTQLSRSLRLKDSAYDFSYDRNGSVLSIYGRDVACDFISGHLSIESQVRSVVKLNDEQYEILKKFYLDEIQSDLNAVMTSNLKESELIKSARLGYRFGARIDGLSLPDLATEDGIDGLMKALFVPKTLNNSLAVLDSVDGKKKEIQILSSVEAKPVKVKLNLNP